MADKTVAQLEAELADLRSRLGEEGFDGLAQCVNPECDVYGEMRPVKMRYDDHVVDTAADMAGMTITTSRHLLLVDDADALCPECEFPSALLSGKPVKYPKMI